MNVTINVDDTGIPHGIREIAEQLPAASELNPGDHIVVKFADGFLYLTGLALLASWRKSLPAGVHVRVDDDLNHYAARNFITNTGFREVMETGHERPSARSILGKVPLRPITNRLSMEATITEIAEIFDEYAGQVRDLNPFKTLLSELGENVLAHSEAVSPGYACGRVLESDHGISAEICIADSGIGIRESFLTGTNEEVIERIKRGANPLEIAVEGLNSSKPKARRGSWKSYFGFGLLITRLLVQENRGQAAILSGDQEIHINRQGINCRQLSRPYCGTFVAVVLDLANPLPLEEIYEEAAAKLIPKEHKDRSEQPLPSQESPAQAGTTEREQADVAEPASERPSRDQSAPQEVEPKTESSEASSEIAVIEMRHYGTELLTREAAIIVRADLATKLAMGLDVEVRLDQVEDITPSVADEAFAKLAEAIGFQDFDRKVKFTGGSSLIQRLIEFVVKTRASKAS